MVKDGGKGEQGQRDQCTKNGCRQQQSASESVHHIAQQGHDGGQGQPQARTGKTIVFGKHLKSEDALSMAVTVQVTSDGAQAELEVHLADRQRFGARPGVDGVVTPQVSRHANASGAGLDEVFAVSHGFVGRKERAPNLPFFVSQVFKAPRQSVFEFNVGETCSVHKDACFGLVEHTFNDDAAAVLFKPTPLDPGLCSEASVFDGHAERDAFAGC